MQVGIGELGLMPRDFWELTFAELYLLMRSNRLRIERNWEIARWEATILINLNVKRSKQVTPEKLVPLSFDQERKAANRLSNDDVKLMIEKWTKPDTDASS